MSPLRRFRALFSLLTGLVAIAAVLAVIPTPAAAADPVVIDDFNDGDTSDWGFFGGNAAGGGGGPAGDRPYEGSGYFSTGWGGEGTASGFYGGAFRNFDDAAQVVPPADAWFNVWVLNQSDATVDGYTLEITIREDLDGDGWTNGADDSFRLDTAYTAADFNDQWTLVSAPVSSFANLNTGGDGTFDGALDEIVIVVAGVTGANPSVVELDFDLFHFTEGPPNGGGDEIVDDFESGLPFAESANGELLGFYTFAGAGSSIDISTVATPPAPVLDAVGEPNNVMAMSVDSTSFAGYIHAFTNPGVDAWVSQDWSTREGISLWFHGQGTGNDLFIDILDNRNPGSTTDDAERWTVPFVDDFSGWQLLEFPFADFVRKEIGNGAPNDGLGLFEMWGYAIGTLGTGGPQTYYIDQVSLYGVAEPPALAAALSINNTLITEGTTGEVAIRLNRPMTDEDPAQVSISYQTEPSTATPGVDYTPTSGTVTFVNGGPTEQTFSLETLADTKFEGNERIVIRLTDPVDVERGALFQGSVLIEDDESFDPNLLDDYVQGSFLWEASDGVTLTTETIASSDPGARPDQDAVENVATAVVVAPGDAYQASIDELVARLGALIPTDDKQDGKRIENALRQLARPADGTLEAFDQLANAVRQLTKVDDNGALGDEVDAIVDELVGLAADLAADGIARAEASGVAGEDLADAYARLADGDGDAAAGRYDRAIVRYRQAWEAAYEAANAAGVGLMPARPTISRDFPLAQDWSDTESIDLWFNGTGSGEPVTLIVKDNAAPDPGPDGWTLAWADEFNAETGTPPNPDNWGYEIGDVTPDGKNGWGNEELQYYTDDLDNAAHDGSGNLVLTLDAADEGLECYYGPCEYESARLISLDRQEFAYGRIESRLLVPEGQGIWPAFWSLGTDITYNPWPAAGEIDFMEFVGRLPNEIFGTIHGPGYAGGNSFGGIYDFGEPVFGSYHTFTVEWEPELITWYVDGIQYHQATPADVAPNPWVFEKPFFLLLNVAIGGNFGGPVGEDFTVPQSLLVDYVRLYQAPDTAERFEADFIDDTEGWTRVSIPVSELTRSAEQPDGAPDDGLTLTEVNGYGFSFPATVSGTYQIDLVERIPVPPPTELTVTTLDGDGEGSLRAAMAAIADGGTITFDPSLAGGTVGLSQQLTATRSMTIDASASPGLILSGSGVDRVLAVDAGASVTLRDLVVRDGVAGPQGAGIFNNGELTLERVTVTDNTLDTAGPPNFAFGGAGVYNGEGASLVMRESTVSNNQSINHPGAGVYGFFGSTMLIEASTISGNVTGDVAGGVRSLGNTTVINSTISGNTSTAWHGGGIFHTDGSLVITNSTVTDNIAPAGTASGVVVATFGAPADLTLTNSIMEGRDGALACFAEGGGAAVITSAGGNIDNDGSCFLTATGDQPNTDAQLGPLADNGGPTLTHAPSATGPAVDAALAGACPATDQRGVTRPQGAGCDVGSVEVG